jgi:hypothetical protein
VLLGAPGAPLRQCGRVLRVVRRSDAAGYAPSAGGVADKQTQVAEHELLTAERHVALLEGFAYLPPQCQQLIAVLIQDPPVPYAEISAKLAVPEVNGSISLSLTSMPPIGE